MPDLLGGKKAIVTGSSRGIGRSIALELARHGADVVVNYNVRGDDAVRVATEIRALGREALVVQASVRNATAVRHLVESAVQAWGALDVMVNNAGVAKDALLMMMSESGWDEVVDTNLKGVFYCCREAIRVMIRRRAGSIINVGSLSGVAGNRGQGNYAAAKGGAISLTKSLAQEVGCFGIRVNVVAPGLIESEMTARLPEEALSVDRVALRRLGRPEEVAQTAVFLASDMASYITGAVLNVNGGLYM